MSRHLDKYKAYEKGYQKEVKEILILTGNMHPAAGKKDQVLPEDEGSIWETSSYFIAYFDLASNTLLSGEGRVTWLVTDEELKEKGLGFPYYFKKNTIYRLKVRQLFERKEIPKDMLPSFFNRFMLLEVLENEVQHEELLKVSSIYQKPIVISDKKLGKFELNKDFLFFEGKARWFRKKVLLQIDVDINDEATWQKGLDMLNILYLEKVERDMKWKAFAAEKLLNLANSWRSQFDKKPINQTYFMKKMRLKELAINVKEGQFEATYNDRRLFYGHYITVYGNMNGELIKADIE